MNPCENWPASSSSTINSSSSVVIKSPVDSSICKVSWLNTSTSISSSSSVITLPRCASKNSYIIGEESLWFSSDKAPIMEALSLVVVPSSKRSISISVSLEFSSNSMWIISASVSKKSAVSSISLSPIPPPISCSRRSSPVFSNARKKPDNSNENKSLPCSNCKSKSVLAPVVSSLASFSGPAKIPEENDLNSKLDSTPIWLLVETVFEV